MLLRLLDFIWQKTNVFRLNGLTLESHQPILKELNQVLFYFMTLGHGWPCSIQILFKPNVCFILFHRLFSRSYYVCLNLCLVVIGLLRPIWLFHDPYNEELSWPRPVAYLLVDTGLPCMTSAFAVLFLALLRATQIELVSPSFQVKLFF